MMVVLAHGPKWDVTNGLFQAGNRARGTGNV